MAGVDSNVKLLCHFNGTDGSTTIVDDYGGNTLTSANGAALETDAKKFGSASLRLKEQIDSDSYTKLLMNFEGHDEGTTFLDKSPSAHTLTANGGVQTESAEQQFGHTSGYFDGNGDYISIPDSDDWNFGSGDFTIEMWVRPSQLSVNGNIWFSQGDDTNNRYSFFSINSKIRFLLYIGGAVKALYETTNNVLSLNTWAHVAFVRSGTNIYIFVNGESKSLTVTTAISTTAMPNLSSEVFIGARNIGGTPDLYYNGYMDDLRVSKGIARYTSNFTAPTKSFVTYGYVTFPANDNFNFGTGEYTIDFWFKTAALLSSSSKAHRIVALLSSTDVNISMSYNAFNTKKIYIFIGDDTLNELISTTELTADTWYHIALVRSGTTVTLYINGTSEDTYTSSMNHQFDLGGGIGFFTDENSEVNCYIDELRISDVARWTSNFTPPTEEYYDTLNQPAVQISTTTGIIQVLEFQRTVSIETSTEITVTSTSHGMSTGDFMVNYSRRSNSQLNAERGSRKVNVVDANTFTVAPAITSMTTGDIVALHKFIDRTAYLLDGTLDIRLRSGGQNEASFTLKTTYTP
jgi:hypothetical protein